MSWVEGEGGSLVLWGSGVSVRNWNVGDLDWSEWVGALLGTQTGFTGANRKLAGVHLKSVRQPTLLAVVIKNI